MEPQKQHNFEFDAQEYYFEHFTEFVLALADEG